MTLGCVISLRSTGAPRRAVVAAQWLLGTELVQGAIGFVQYATDLPVVLVGLHLLGAALVVVAATWTVLSITSTSEKYTTATGPSGGVLGS